ncbi:MAG: hypothetical protein AAF572_00635 [Cyanobacteria bacterium P01_B01_bin.77]
MRYSILWPIAIADKLTLALKPSTLLKDKKIQLLSTNNDNNWIHSSGFD